MDDLAGLDWNAAGQQSTNKPAITSSTSNYYPSLRPTPPISGRTTPLPPSLPKPPPTPTNLTPKIDSFANLIPSLNANQSSKNLSLKEQQALLEEQKRQKLSGQSRQWDILAPTSSSTSTNVSRTASPASFSIQALNGQSSGLQGLSKTTIPLQNFQAQSRSSTKRSEDVDDILAAFDAAAPVDKSSHFPVPSREDSTSSVSLPVKGTKGTSSELLDDDDDPFGLGTARPVSNFQGKAPLETATDDDDVLGLLGKPVSELPPSRQDATAVKSEGHPVDAAIAELVDMGFPAEKARIALATTESGMDVQAAVGYLLNQAHSQSRSKQRETSGGINGYDSHRDDEPGLPQQQRNVPQQRDSSNGPAKDPAKMASDIGQSFFKTANSLWKAGQKKVNKAMADFNTEADPSQPKWMRDAAPRSDSQPVRNAVSNGLKSRQVESESFAGGDGLTNEAALLESGGRPPAKTKRTQPVNHPDIRSQRAPAERPRWQDDDDGKTRQSAKLPDMQPPKVAPTQPRMKLTRESNEETSAYISPARRKKSTPKPAEPEPNLLFDDNQANGNAGARSARSAPLPQPVQKAQQASTRPSIPAAPSIRPKPKSREVPLISPSILNASTKNRVAGTAAFKLGNYSEAHDAYTKALRDVPSQQPLTIVLLTNRALTSLKTGDPKQCIADADQALQIIGPSKGIEEMIAIGGDEGTKDMAPYWGKAMMRRAEAMEQLERWEDAAKVWKECVEAGVGGAQSVQGRARCEKASGTGQASQPVSRRPTPAPKKSVPKQVMRSAMDDLTGRPASVTADSSEAVTRLRAANDAAAKLDDERFALTDAVAARIETWRKGKEQNLRALLGSLDTVLWPDAGWKKIGMAELLNPSKVKINYMKGIAKVHPDKLPTTATTEQIMISGAVFSTLNEAWDGFKKENGL